MRFTILTLCFLIQTSVWAQSATDKPLIEEVVVTAQRIEQNASDVPIALSAYTVSDIRDRQIIGIWDLELNVPSFSYVPNNFGGAQITIRGIGELRAAEAGKGTLGKLLQDDAIPAPASHQWCGITWRPAGRHWWPRQT